MRPVLPKIGVAIAAAVNGRVFTGRVRFANPGFISVDEGDGVVAIFRFDSNLNSWRMGKSQVTWQAETETLNQRLNRLIDMYKGAIA